MQRNGVGKLSALQKVIYGSGNLAANLMNATVSAYITFYYTDVAGIPVAAAGMILLLCKILDGITDLMMGIVVENTHTKDGKARPWIKRMAIPFGIAVFLMFFSPNWGVTGKIIYAAATYVAGIAIVYTAITVPYNTMSALITDNTEDRNTLATLRQFFGMIGPLTITTISLPIINALGGDQRAWSLLAGIYGAIGTVIYFLVYFTSKEIEVEPVGKKDSDKREKGALWKHVKLLFQNKYWVLVLFMTLLLMTYSGIRNAIMVYYCNYVLNNSNYFSILSFAGMLPTILCCFFVPALAKKFGKRNLCIAGCMMSIVGQIIMLFGSENLIVLTIANIVLALGVGPIVIFIFAMLGDTAVYGEWKTGEKNAGLIFSASTFSEKIGNAVGGALTTFAMAIGGYVANESIQSASSILSMKICYIWLPIVLLTVLIILLKCYHLDDELPQILKEMEADQ